MRSSMSDVGVSERPPEGDSGHLAVGSLHLSYGPSPGHRQPGAYRKESVGPNTDEEEGKHWQVHMSPHVFQHLSALLGF